MPYSFPKNVALGQKTIVTCVAQSGASPLDFQWWHNGRAIVDTSSRYSKKLAERVSTMSIEKLSAEDLGNYTCVVSNSAGQDTFTAPLLVEGERYTRGAKSSRFRTDRVPLLVGNEAPSYFF